MHMNGRVYDYNVGRFMSVDPFIQAPGNSQSVNPFSYVMNNPSGGTDPNNKRGVATLNVISIFLLTTPLHSLPAQFAGEEAE